MRANFRENHPFRVGRGCLTPQLLGEAVAAGESPALTLVVAALPNTGGRWSGTVNRAPVFTSRTSAHGPLQFTSTRRHSLTHPAELKVPVRYTFSKNYSPEGFLLGPRLRLKFQL